MIWFSMGPRGTLRIWLELSEKLPRVRVTGEVSASITRLEKNGNVRVRMRGGPASARPCDLGLGLTFHGLSSIYTCVWPFTQRYQSGEEPKVTYRAVLKLVMRFYCLGTSIYTLQVRGPT